MKAELKVESIPLNNLYAWQQVALMRLLMFVTGQVQRIMEDFTHDARAIVLKEAGPQGKVDLRGAYRTQAEVGEAWAKALKELQALMQSGIQEGVSLPFGVQAAYHEKLIVEDQKSKVEGRRSTPFPAFPGKDTGAKQPQIAGKRDLGEGVVVDGVFGVQLREILDAVRQMRGPDGKMFSERIWALNQMARGGMNTAIMAALQDQKSAWQLAQDLEKFLGAGADCPRWTYARLNEVPSVDKAKGDARGLIGGEDCAGQGVSYNALRLARTEIQRAHHLANDNRMKGMPWIEQERIVLSGSHPQADECDDVAHGGDNGDGVYPVGTIELPIHPNCFCDKRAVQDLEKFGNDLSGWVRGESFPAMDTYAASLGADWNKSLLGNPVASALGVWAFDKFDELVKRIGN